MVSRKKGMDHYNKYKDNRDFKKRRSMTVMKHYYKNRSKKLIEMKKYRDNNPKRFALYKIISPTARPKRPLEYWQNRYHLIHVCGLGCKICNLKTNLHIHHIIPESKGGNHKLNNLEVYCKYHHFNSGLHAGLRGR